VAFGVVDTFLVRAADDAVGHDHGASLMLAKEGLDLLADNRIVAYIDVFGEPAFEHVGRFAFVGDDGDGNLGGQVRSRAIECNRRDRVAPESAPSTLRQPGSRPFSDLLHVLMKYLELRVSVKGQDRFAVFSVILDGRILRANFLKTPFHGKFSDRYRAKDYFLVAD
jgi:hypothetical protein